MKAARPAQQGEQGGGADGLPPLILASGSPRRRELLAGLGLRFRVVVPGIEEISACTDPAEIACDLAEQKARATSQGPDVPPGALILACDTLVALDTGPAPGEQLLGKPQDALQNAEYLRRLSGRTHSVYSGVALLRAAGGGGELASGVERTQVTFRALSDAEILYYAASGEGLDKAGGYGIQGLGMALVSSIQGEYSNVVGLPLTLVMRLLRAAGLPVWGRA